MTEEHIQHIRDQRKAIYDLDCALWRARVEAERDFEDWVADLEKHVGKKLILSLKPTKLIAPRSMFKLAMKILYYKPPIRKVKGMRARKRALYWRRK